MERRAGTRQGWSPACFNPRSRVGSDDRIFGNEVADHVSIHAPAWGATRSGAGCCQVVSCFNPRSRVGSDGTGEVIVRHKGRVSIHAPAWGATGHSACMRFQRRCFNPRSRVGSDAVIGGAGSGKTVSIHAPAWGATSGSFGLTSLYPQFQSTLPRGERHPDCAFSPSVVAVSIHAPAWGATSRLKTSAPFSMFQSTLPRGERPEMGIRKVDFFEFQSTLPRGERPNC